VLVLYDISRSGGSSVETKMRAVIHCYRKYSTIFSRFVYTFLQIKKEENEKERKEIKLG